MLKWSVPDARFNWYVCSYSAETPSSFQVEVSLRDDYGKTGEAHINFVYKALVLQFRVDERSSCMN